MHSINRFFVLSFLLATVLIFANFLSFYIPANHLTAQINSAYYNKYYSSFISLAYDDYTGFSYYCPIGFTGKGYFKPDGVSQTSGVTASDISGKTIKSGWLQLCVNNSYPNSVISRHFDDYNPYKTATVLSTTGSSVTAGTASGAPSYIKDNNEATAYGVRGSCARGSCFYNITAQINIPPQDIPAVYFSYVYNTGNTSGQANAVVDVFSNGAWVNINSEGGTVNFGSPKTKTGPWTKVTAIRVRSSAKTSYSVCPSGALCKTTIPNSFSVKDLKILQYNHYACPALYSNVGGYFKIDATPNNLALPSGVDYANNKMNSGWFKVCNKLKADSYLGIAYNDYSAAPADSTCKAGYLWAGNFKPDSVVQGGGSHRMD